VAAKASLPRARPPLPAGRVLLEGVSCALGAGLLWGLVFVVPLMLPDYPPAMLSFGRYLSFGVIALLLACTDWPRLQSLQRQDWEKAFELALVGNILYYLFLSAAVQLADAPLPTMLIGTLPIVIAIAANFSAAALPWRRLLPSLLVIATGIALVNRHEMALLDDRHSAQDYFLGTAFALAAVAAWTWYPLRNSRWLQQRPRWLPAPGPSPRDWRHCHWRCLAWPLPACISTGMAASISARRQRRALRRPDADPRILRFVARHPALESGQPLAARRPRRPTDRLRNLAAFAYAFILRAALPGSTALIGIALLVGGVILGVRAFRGN
jgi:drug/metabolite transporter (DMT)-like permease